MPEAHVQVVPVAFVLYMSCSILALQKGLIFFNYKTNQCNIIALLTLIKQSTCQISVITCTKSPTLEDQIRYERYFTILSCYRFV